MKVLWPAEMYAFRGKAEISQQLPNKSSGTMVANNLTVGTSGSDINLNSTSITSGQTVTISSGTITHSA